MGVARLGPVKADRGIRARVPAAGKALEGDDQRTLSPLYYDWIGLIGLVLLVGDDSNCH